MRLLLATHAETEWNALGRFQGHADLPLNEQGREQACRLRQRLAQEKLHAIISSDLRRAWETAEILALPHGLTVGAEPRLRELHFGNWEGLTYAEIQLREPQTLAEWQKNPLRTSPPGGESLASLTRRLLEFLGDLANRPTEQAILLVGHRGSFRVLLCLLRGMPVERHWEFRLGLASLTEVEIASNASWPLPDGRGSDNAANTTLLGRSLTVAARTVPQTRAR